MKEITLRLTDGEYALIKERLPVKFLRKCLHNKKRKAIKQLHLHSLCRLYLLEKIYKDEDVGNEK